MKYLPKYTWRLVCCQECQLPGLTLVRKGGKIKGKPSVYVHQTPLMCEVSKMRNRVTEEARKIRERLQSV